MQEKKPYSLSVVMPVYNEEALLENAVVRCLDVLSRDFADFELILVDDGSSDDSGRIIDDYAASIEQVKALHNNVNLNYGVSVQRAIAAATKEYILPDSVDLALAPEDMFSLIEQMQDLDLLILERKHYRGATLWRRITSKINRLMLHVFFPRVTAGLRDLNYTQIIRRSVVPKVMPLAKSPAFTLSEMILRAKYHNLRVDAVTVDYHARPKGKGALGRPHDIIWTIYDMFRFRIRGVDRTLNQ